MATELNGLITNHKMGLSQEKLSNESLRLWHLITVIGDPYRVEDKTTISLQIVDIIRNLNNQMHLSHSSSPCPPMTQQEIDQIVISCKIVESVSKRG